jgi:hypothetical protein
MTNETRLLITETTAVIVREVDNRILTTSKKQCVEKLLEKFVQDIVALDNKTPTTAPEQKP